MNERQLFLAHLAQTSDFPLMLDIRKAKGSYLYGPKGKKYIDLIAGIGVSNVGHRHPKVLRAIERQLGRYLHVMVYGEYIQSPQIRLAKALCETLPDTLNSVYLVNSGAEAVEGAMKLAKRATGRSQIIACHDSYHGSTQGALSLGNEHFRQSFRPLLPGIRKIRHGQHEDLAFIDHQTAAIVIEVVQAEAGVRVRDQAYFEALRERCTETGCLLIFDEIQTGFGRTGTFWAFEHYGVVPDILLTAKGMGGGMPIGAFIAGRELMSCLKDHPILGHITTFGGHPVSSAAALATLKVIAKEKLIAQVPEKEALFRELLVHPLIREVRGKGLMMALAFDHFPQLKSIIDQTIRLGVITDWFLYCDNAMRIAPPLTITPKQIRKACTAILQAIDHYAASSPD